MKPESQSNSGQSSRAVNSDYDAMGNRTSAIIASPATTATLTRRLTWGQDLAGSPSLQGAGGVGGLLMVEEITSTTNEAYHFHYDGNGNVTEITDHLGASVATYRYDAFGNTLVATGTYAATNRYRFSTKPLDHEVTTAPLYYYGYRYMDPLTGRWPSRDPIGERGGVNLYGFVGNDGVNQRDFLGLHYGVGGGDPYFFYVKDDEGKFTQKSGKTLYKITKTPSSESCEIEVSITVFLHGDGDMKKLRKEAQAGVDRAWNDRFEFDCPEDCTCPIIPIKFRINFVEEHAGNVATVHVGNSPSHQFNWNPNQAGGMANVAAHEFGHFLGNPDEYGITKPDNDVDTPETDHGSQPDNVMNTPTGRAQSRHLDKLLDDSFFTNTPGGKWIKGECKLIVKD